MLLRLFLRRARTVLKRGEAINSALIRQFNVARIFHALRDHPDSSQLELSSYAGVNKATVSAVIAQLDEAGLIHRSVRQSKGRPGRPEVALSISAQAGLLVGVRLEPSTIRLIATSLDGQVRGRLQVAGSRDVEGALHQLREATLRLAATCGFTVGAVRGIGVGIPGLMDSSGRLVLAPNLGWRDVAILERLREALDAPVFVDNDTKAAALAEKLFGKGRKVRDFIYITGHSGVGGGLFLGGRLYRGAGGFAGEIGHIKVVPGGRPCACGGRGCLEAYASEEAILARLAERGVVLGDIWAVARRAEAGDEEVLAILGETGEFLGLVAANLINVLNPSLVVLGGNLAAVAQAVLPVVARVIEADALSAPRAQARVIVSPLGAESVPMGGVALALEGFLALPGLLTDARLAATEPRDADPRTP
ncbi:MAG: ROK family protein [Deinococcota bacterium]|nr:ROK family protein [Deinococcota bacterium]